MTKRIVFVTSLAIFAAASAFAQSQPPAASRTKVVLLGTGTPGPAPERSGPATNADGNQHEFPQGHEVKAHEVAPGIVYKDANVTVTAFATKHAMESYGYRFQTADRSIVISGDTNPTPATIAACTGCDVLIHEVHTPAWLLTRPQRFQRFADKFHTTTAQLADLAKQAKPRLLILYHYNGLSAEELFDDMSGRYAGQFVVGRDLDVY